MPSRIFQPNKGNLQGIADKVTQDEIRKLWEYVQLRTGQIGDPNERHVTLAELQELARRIPSTDPQSTGYRATTLGGENAPSTEGGGGGGGNPIAVKDEGVLITSDTRIFNFIGAAVTATQVGTQTNIEVVGSTGGISKSVEYFVSGTFTVPENVSFLWLTMVGGGGGGGSRNVVNNGGGGGASAEYCINFPYPVVAGSVLTVTIGQGGAGAIGAGGTVAGSSGTATTVDAVSVQGGGGAPSTTGGAGGGFRGGAGGGANVIGSLGSHETPVHFGGSGGSGGGSGASIAGVAGIGAGGYWVGAAGGAAGGGQCGGGGGAATIWGIGGAGGAGGANGVDAPTTSYGAGGGGSGGKTPTGPNGGRGANGYVLIGWIGAA